MLDGLNPKLTLVTAAVDTPVGLQELKDWARVDTDDDDATLRRVLLSATRTVEELTRRALMTQTWRLSIDGMPGDRFLELPRPPLSSVSSFVYFDLDGTQSTFDLSSNADVITTSEPGRIVLHSGSVWPTGTRRYDSARITFVAGYSSRDEIPEPLREIVMMIALHRYDMRTGEDLPRDIRDRIWAWKVPA